MKTMEHCNVKIFTDNIEDLALEQIHRLLSMDAFYGCKIRIMPDVHAGAGCVIGFTGNMGDKVIPNIVGVDIGCGILVQPLVLKTKIDYHAFNEHILYAIPTGRNSRMNCHMPLPDQYMNCYREAKKLILELHCYRELKEQKRLYKSIGSLGGGNHFIELGRDEQNRMYLMVHTGSRNLGKQVADIYQNLAIKYNSGWDKLLAEQTQLIEEYKQTGRKNELQATIRDLHNSSKMRKPSMPSELCYVEGVLREDYLHDMRLCQRWAQINRRLIADLLIDFLVRQGCIADTDRQNAFESVHNYIGDDNIIRKGAISACRGERCIIPLNMRDGSLLCTGKGNEDWNNSAPHGAGRVLSRKRAFRELHLDEFQKAMDGIYSETVTEATLDESPMAYKPAEEILQNIQETVDVISVIKPTFNFKAAE